MPVFATPDLVETLRRGARVALIVRHAERPAIDPGDPSFGDALPLTEKGARDAETLGVALRPFAHDVQFAASPLLRTRQTADRIAAGMGVADPDVPTDERLGNGSFYYDDPGQVVDIFKPGRYLASCFEYFRTARFRGFRDLYAATDDFERWIDARWSRRLFVISTHDLYVAAFLSARKACVFTEGTWPGYLDGGALVDEPGSPRRYMSFRSS